MSEILSVIAVAVLVATPLIIVLLLAELDVYFTKPPQGAVTFISAGDRLKEIVPNLRGYELSKGVDSEGRQWLLPVKDVAAESFLLKTFGIKFISIFWPNTHVQRIDLGKTGRRHLIDELGKQAGNKGLEDLIAPSTHSPVVTSLLFLAPRPIYMKSVELPEDNSSIDLLLLVTFRLVIPEIPVYNYKEFYPLLDAHVRAGVVDFASTHKVAIDKEGRFVADELEQQDGCSGARLTYDRWLRLNKSGPNSVLAEHLLRLNISMSYVDNLESSDMKSYAEDLCRTVKDQPATNGGSSSAGLIPQLGFAIESVRIVGWDPDEKTKALAEALLSEETETALAQGVRAKAEGAKEAQIKDAEGQSAFAREIVTALKSQGVDANVAAKVVETMVRTRNIDQNSKITTYVEGGGNTSVNVSTGSAGEQPKKE